jgi:hypothetical protein
MKIFRHLGLMIAVFWCAAMVVAPMAAAAGAGQGMNQAPGAQGITMGQANQGNNQMQQGQGTRSGNNQQGNSQSNAGPGQGNGPQGMDRGNMSEFGNMTPPGDWDPANMTALNRTAGHGHGNMTGFNMSELNRTDMHPPGDWNPANMTAGNQTGRGHSNGNLTPPGQLPQQNGASQGQVENQNQQPGQNQPQAQNQNNSNDSLVAELMDWLKAHGIS